MTISYIYLYVYDLVIFIFEGEPQPLKNVNIFIPNKAYCCILGLGNNYFICLFVYFYLFV